MKLDRRAKKAPIFFGAVGAELLQSKAPVKPLTSANTPVFLPPKTFSCCRCLKKSAIYAFCHGEAVAWPRPEFRQILFEIWVASALNEICGKFRPVAGLSARDKSLRKFWTFIAH